MAKLSCHGFSRRFYDLFGFLAGCGEPRSARRYGPCACLYGRLRCNGHRSAFSWSLSCEGDVVSMNEVAQIAVTNDEDGLRLDRWFRRHFPLVTHGRLEKLLRTGQVRVDGARAKANVRLEQGQIVRVPPLGDEAVKPAPKADRGVSEQDAAFIRSLVIHKDKSILVLNKPAGLAVQGGT